MQKLPIVITPASRCVRYHVCSQVAKILGGDSPIWNRTFSIEWRKSRSSTPRFWPLSWSKFLLFLLFYRISHKCWEIKQTLLLSSDRKSCICHLMANLRILCIVTLIYNFKVTTILEIILYLISGKRWELAKIVKYVIYRCWQLDTSHRITRLRILYIVNVTYIFRITQFLEILYLIPGRRWELSKNAQVRLLQSLICAIENHKFRFSTTSPDLNFESQKFKILTLSKW